jgi:hypothetical protein
LRSGTTSREHQAAGFCGMAKPLEAGNIPAEPPIGRMDYHVTQMVDGTKGIHGMIRRRSS